MIKNVVVTGADGALGSNCVAYFLKKNYQVAAICGSAAGEKRLQETLARAEVSTNCRIISHVDLSNELLAKKVLGAATEVLGGIDALLHTVGGFHWGKTLDLTSEQHEFLLRANYLTSWQVVRSTLPAMLERKMGRLVFISAYATQTGGSAGLGGYLASKCALNGLVSCLAQELKGTNVTVNAILPTIIDTPRNRKDMPDSDYSKWVTPDDVANTAEFIWNTSSMQGALVPLTGGV